MSGTLARKEHIAVISFVLAKSQAVKTGQQWEEKMIQLLLLSELTSPTVYLYVYLFMFETKINKLVQHMLSTHFSLPRGQVSGIRTCWSQ